MGTHSQKLVCVLPYVRISSSTITEKGVRIGPAQFWPDSEDVWRDVIKSDRPPWLDIYRDFPTDKHHGPEPARGSILVSESEEWLEQPGHIENAIAVLYSLGQVGDQLSFPAEAFFNQQFKTREQYGSSVRFRTKSHHLLEDTDSIQLLPPLELRGVNRPYKVRTDTQEAVELLHRFNESPDDRLIVGCYHFFRAQFWTPP